MEKKRGWGYNVLIGLDQLLNAFLGGHADETISSRCYRGAVLAKPPKRIWVIAERCINALFFDPKHCRRAYIAEVKRRQLPPEFQEI